jgi:O-6-methylguanine DNA methyltransferase
MMKETLTGIRAGSYLAYFSEQGLARLEFPSDRRNRKPAEGATADLPPGLCRWRAITRKAVEQALAGRKPAVLPALDLAAGSAFQREVWKALLTIPPGQTRTYAQVAALVGRPKAVRAVGQACGANPIPVLIPCHRVVSSDGGLGGFSAGIEWKKRLLAAEGRAGFG